ncbi:hypothetical protein BGZ46_006625 [Entomortierella lignicola]|nr:hypothetical protein BGZ46_006625 [Entomortierella lignicola]
MTYPGPLSPCFTLCSSTTSSPTVVCVNVKNNHFSSPLELELSSKRSPILDPQSNTHTQVKDCYTPGNSRSPSPSYSKDDPLTMSGPNQVQDIQTNTDHEHKERRQSHSRIRISNLLCSIEAAEPIKSEPWASPKTEAVNLEGLSYAQSSQSPPPKVWHTDRDYRDEYSNSRSFSNTQIQTSPIRPSPRNDHDQQHSSSPSSSNSIHNEKSTYPKPATIPHDPRRHMEISERRDSGLGRRDIETRDTGHSRYDRTYSSSNWDQSSRSTPREHDSNSSPISTVPGQITSRSTSSAQRSASLHVDYYRDNRHPYDVDHQKSRKDRSNSDFAIHQQNYGPYLDTSPSLPPAPLFQTRPASPRSDRHDQASSQPPSPPSVKPPTYYYDHPNSPHDHTRSPYQTTHAPRRSIQGDIRRTSQSIILPSPESLYTSEPRKPTRIYGLDAADVPARPPLAPSASFGAKPLQDIPDEHEVEYSRRASTHHTDPVYRYSRDSDSRYSQRPYEYQTTSSHTTNPNNSHSSYRSSAVDRPHYNYSPQDTPYSQNRSEYDQSSPGQDIQPPAWYRQYANAVIHKHHSRSSSSRGDPQSYSPNHRRESDYASSQNMIQSRQQRSPEHWSSRPSFSAGPPTNPSIGVPEHISKPTSRSSISTSHSVHPFDVAAGSPTSPPSVTGKRDRGQEDDPFISEDGVKAKRKRANAEQLSVLNAAFERSYFPSTEERLRLSKQTKMCPRTVQIWFQNKRQSVKARTEAMDVAVAAAGAGRRRGSQLQNRSREDNESDGNAGHSLQQQQDEDQKQYTHNHQYQQQHHHQQQRHLPLGPTVSRTGEKRRNSGPLTPSDPVTTSPHISPEDHGDYFSRKRRATIAQMEQREY